MAQSVEQLIRNQQVAGSSPATSSNPKTSKVLKYQGFRGFSFFTFGEKSFQKLSTVVYWLFIFVACLDSCSPRFLLIVSAIMLSSAKIFTDCMPDEVILNRFE